MTKRKRILILVATAFMLFFLASLITGAISNSHKSPKAIAQKFMKAVDSGQADQAYALTNNGFQFSKTKDEWKQTVTGLQTVYKGEATLVDTTKDDDTLTKVSFKQPGVYHGYNITISVRLNDQKVWQVERFTSKSE